MKMPIPVGKCLKRYVSVSKEVHKKNFAAYKSVCTLQELYTAFKKKTPKCKYWVLKVLCLETQMVCSKMTHSVCVWSAHQNVVLLDKAIDWNLTYKDLIKKTVYNPENNKYIMHQCESCPGTATLKEFLDQELKEHENDEKFNYCH